MDLATYLVTAVVVTFMVAAAVALWLSIVSGQWRHLDAASRIVLDGDEPVPTRKRGAN